jgi:predicted SnoaL-like aldol condensation-catalyzing enzyme
MGGWMMKSAILTAALLLASVCTQANAAPPADAALTEANRKVVTHFIDLFYTQHKVREAFETYVVPEYIQHNPIATDGRDAAINALEPFFKSMPNLKHEVHRILVDGNLAAVHVKGTSGPSDRGFAVVDLFRLENGKIVEHWDVIQPVPEKSANSHPMF